MIVAFVVAMVASLLWMPWWVLCAFATIYGFALRPGWRIASYFALFILMTSVSAAYILEHHEGFVIAHRMAGVFSVPTLLIYLLPGLINGWITLFFARLGASLRVVLEG
jgi:hypothetical protein